MLIPSLPSLAEALSGTVVLPGDPGWDHARSAFNLLLDQHPAAVAFPSDAQDVAAAVAFARAAGLRVAPQATGHNAGPARRHGEHAPAQRRRAAGGPRRCRGPARARRRRRQVGRGSRRGCPRSAWPALHGSSPDVGIAGYSLGGGMGWLARKHGLQANSRHRARAGHRRRRARPHATPSTSPDLFWALRGGGGNFGVVTAIEFAVYEVDGALRRRAVLPVRALGRGAAHLERPAADAARRAHVVGVGAALPADPGRARRSRAGARSPS